MKMMSRTQLRQKMRAQRCALSPSEQLHASLKLAEHIAASRLFINSRHIAFYLPNDGEINLLPLLEHAWEQQKTCYLPVLGLRNSRRLWFLPFYPNSELSNNRYGIPEPLHSYRDRLSKPLSLDLILMPLVAFDANGHRLGMGGGFYDRTLAFLHTRRHWRKPRLLGAAYAFQQTEQITEQSWDVPLHGIATEEGLQLF